MQRELLNTQCWVSQQQLATATSELIEAWYNLRPRYTSLGMLPPHECETPDSIAEKAE
jgi:hypothetical protein